jgi:hypothetical protein
MDERTGGDVVHKAAHHLNVHTLSAVASIQNLPILDATATPMLRSTTSQPSTV